MAHRLLEAVRRCAGGGAALMVLACAAFLLMGINSTYASGGCGGGSGGGGAGEQGAGAHQHLDSRFDHDRYYYDRGYAVARPPAGEGAELTGPGGERYYFAGGNWFRWRSYRFWGAAWEVIDAPPGMLVPVRPPHCTAVSSGGSSYCYANDTFYAWNVQRHAFEVVPAPSGVTGN